MRNWKVKRCPKCRVVQNQKVDGSLECLFCGGSDYYEDWFFPDSAPHQAGDGCTCPKCGQLYLPLMASCLSCDI